MPPMRASAGPERRGSLARRWALGLLLELVAWPTRPTVAQATEPETLSDLEREEDLYELYDEDVIDEATLDHLLQQYDLDGDGPNPDSMGSQLRGELRIQTHRIVGDQGLPPSLLQTRLALGPWQAGAAVALLRQRAGDASYDASRQALLARPAHPTPQLPKLYLQWRQGQAGLIAGSYRIGFGQGLTFDTTGTPWVEGFRPDLVVRRGLEPARACRLSRGELGLSPCTGAAAHRLTTPDYGWSDGLRGLALSLKQLPLGSGKLDLHGFASYQTHALYQYQLADLTRCERAADGACVSPVVYLHQPDPHAPAPAHAWQTLPALYDLGLLGARLRYALAGVSLGTTAYAAAPRWRVHGATLDFQHWARHPPGGPFGAAGIDAAWQWQALTAQLELARSFDSAPGAGGGWAGIGRAQLPAGPGTLDASVRHYATGFANPHARALAAPDRHEGLRTRDETGLRVGYLAQLPEWDLDLRALSDVWYRPSLDVGRLHARVRADKQLGDPFTVGLEFDLTDRHLRPLASQHCGVTELREEHDDDDETRGCGLARYHLIARLGIEPSDKLRLRLRHRISLHSDRDRTAGARHDSVSWLSLRSEPWSGLWLDARVRHRYLDLRNPDRLEHSLRAHLELSGRLPGGSQLRLRYEVIGWLDGRASTQLRSPSPVHWVWVEARIRWGD